MTAKLVKVSKLCASAWRATNDQSYQDEGSADGEQKAQRAETRCETHGGHALERRYQDKRPSRTPCTRNLLPGSTRRSGPNPLAVALAQTALECHEQIVIQQQLD